MLSKKRRNHGPKHVRLFVTNLLEVKAGTVLRLYAWRWGVEVTIKELKGGLHLGQIQVTRDKDHVKRRSLYWCVPPCWRLPNPLTVTRHF
jgi:hypothetical protein